MSDTSRRSGRPGLRGVRFAWALSALVGALSLSATAGATVASAQGFLRAFPEGGDPIRMPLTEEHVEVRIDGQYATSELRQTYQNETGATVEGRYALNAGTGARAQGFAYYNGDQRIVGEVFERQAAREVYEEVTGLGRDPGLLEEEADGTFTFRVFPIEAGEPKRIEVRWGQWLTRRGEGIEYRAPLSFQRATGSIRITDDRAIREVRSSTHAISLDRRADGDVRVTVGDPIGDSSRLVLTYAVESAEWGLHTAVHRDPGHDPYLAVALSVPENVGADAVSAKDVTLVLDRSGSMSGAPLQQAKRAAMEIIGRVAERDRLNVLIFDHEVEALHGAPVPANEVTRREATAFVDRATSRGGTDIATAIASSLAAQHDDDRPHVILFLTDGQSDARRALEVAREDRGDARIYTIGVGAGVHRPLLSRLAQEKRGAFTYIEGTDAIVPRMTALYDQIASPVLVGLEMEVEGARAYDRYPRTLPDLHRHQELRIASRLAGEGPVKIRIRGTLDGAPFVTERQISIEERNARPWVGRLWASAKVDDLLEDIALLGEEDERKDVVVELALAYSFTTPYTAFLAIPESELTDAARDDLEAMRQARRQLMARHADAAALSRSAMPPGDPILRVHAPIDAVQVTAHFPFGLVKDLHYDPETELWECRFLVPVDVEDESYAVEIVVVPAHGEPYLAQVEYTIDSAEPDFEATATVNAARGVAALHVAVAEPARRVSAARVDDPRVRVELEEDPETGVYRGELPLAEGETSFRVVVADLARNEADTVLRVVRAGEYR